MTEYTNSQSRAKMANDFQTQIAAIERELAGWDSVAMLATNNDLTAKLQPLIDRRARLQLQLDQAQNTRKGENCAICGAPPETQFKGNPDIIGGTLFKVNEEIAGINQQIDANNHVMSVNQGKLTHRDGLIARLQGIQPPGDIISEAQFQVLLQRYDNQVKLVSALEKSRSELSVVSNTCTNLKSNLAYLNAQVQQSQSIILNEAQIVADATQAQRVLDRISTLKIESATNNTLVQEKQNHLTSLKALLEQITQKKKQKRLQKYVELLEEVRSLTHRNNIPHVINKRFLNQLIVQINGYLTKFDTPFKVTVGENLEFRSEMNYGAIVPALALSGGQQSMLAMAFLLSVFQANASRTGLLLIDEGGDGLDVDNRKIFNTSLQCVDEIFRKRDQQLITISHDASLADLFYTIAL